MRRVRSQSFYIPIAFDFQVKEPVYLSYIFHLEGLVEIPLDAINNRLTFSCDSQVVHSCFNDCMAFAASSVEYGRIISTFNKSELKKLIAQVFMPFPA
jgi:hypothetical protein